MNPSQYLPIRAGIKDVGPLFNKRGFLASLLPSSNKSNNAALPRIEQIWFPYYLLNFQVTSTKGPGTMLCSVEAWSGSFAIFQMDDLLIDGLPDDGPIFPASLSQAEAEASGRKELLHTIMRQRSRGAKPIPEAIIDTRLILFPVYVYYFERKIGFVDIKLREAVTGAGLGQRTKSALLQAFLERDKE